jgi:hypothetical protein
VDGDSLSGSAAGRWAHLHLDEIKLVMDRVEVGARGVGVPQRQAVFGSLRHVRVTAFPPNALLLPFDFLPASGVCLNREGCPATPPLH